MLVNKTQFASPRSSRRSMLKGIIGKTAGIAGVASITTAGFLVTEQNGKTTHASALDNGPSSPENEADSIQTILNIAVTAETLAAVFYTEALLSANALGLSIAAQTELATAQNEEEVHRAFLVKQGAKAMTTTFAFPHGINTFRNFDFFLKTQQWLESLFVTAYILASKEFALLQRPDLVQIAAQMSGVEAEHRAIGRAIGGLRPFDNWVFESVSLNKVSDVANLLRDNGFFWPSNGNSFTFKDTAINTNGLSMTDPATSNLPNF